MNYFTAILLMSLFAVPAMAEVKLTTLPDRERVVVSFEDNGRVLVEEARTLTLDQGLTTVNFTWLGVSIDRSSIQMMGVSGVPFTVIRATYPPNQNNSLSWDVSSQAAGPAQVRISYLLDGLNREVAMRAVIDEGQPTLSLRLYQRLINGSGETYDQATLRASFGELRDSPLASGETRQQLAAKFIKVPFIKRYTFDPQQGHERVKVDYVVRNNAESNLGTGMLPGAKVRVFQLANGSEAFMGEDWAAPTPLGEELALHLGDSKDVTVRRAMLKTRQEIVQRDHKNRPALWHEARDFRFEVENFTNESKVIEIIEHTDGEWDLIDPVQLLEKRIAPEQYELAVGEANPLGELERKDASTLVIKIPVPANRRVVFTGTIRRLNLH